MGQIFLSFTLLPLFLFACLFSFVIPGLFLLSILGYKKEKDSYILATALGISLFLLLNYTFSWLQLHHVPLIIIGFINIYVLWKKRSLLSSKYSIQHLKPLCIIFFGSLVLTGLTWFSGIEIFGIKYFWGINASDGVVHISRIENLLHTFPPTHPGLSGVVFNGYHYFYDLLISRFSLFFGFSPTDLYLRYFSLFTSLFYGASFLYFIKNVTNDVVKRRLVLLFAYFSAGISSLFYFLNPEYSAMIAHPLLLVFDPSVLLSLGLLLIFFIQLIHVKIHIRYAIVAGILLGVLSQLKVYVGILGIVVLICYSLYSLIRFKKKILPQLFMINGIAGILTIITFFPNNVGSGSLLFEPFRFYSHYIQQEFFSGLQWENRRLAYISANNKFFVLILYILAVGMYWIVTLGTTVYLVAFIPRLFKKKFWKNDFNLILTTAILFAFLIPMFFLQSIAAFDIGQFYWMLVSFLCIPAGMLLGELYVKKRPIGLSLLVLFIISGMIQVFQVYNVTYMGSNLTYSMSKAEKNVYEKISDKVRSKEFVVVLPKLITVKEGILDPHPSSLVAAMTGRSTYYENEKIDYAQLDSIYGRRKGNLFAMHDALEICDHQGFTDILERTGSPYLVVKFQSPCLATHSALLEVASSEKAVFYKLQEK